MSTKKIVFRCDASSKLGTGHVMRCLTLADELRQEGCSITFICREISESLAVIIQNRGYRMHLLQGAQEDSREGIWTQDAQMTAEVIIGDTSMADWLVVDHYSLDQRWEKRMRMHTRKIMVIDDLADRPHDCDLLLDQNFYLDRDTRYAGLVPPNCVALLGPQYALLRPEFKEARKSIRQRDGSVDRILVFFGGSDPTGETSKALEALRLLSRPEINVDVVAGMSNQRREELMELCMTLSNVSFYCQVDYMAVLMARADLSLGAAGSTSWERCCMGLPTITAVTALNQKKVAEDLARVAASINLGWHATISSNDYLKVLNRILSRPEELRGISRGALFIMKDLPQDGCSPVASRLLE